MKRLKYFQTWMMIQNSFSSWRFILQMQFLFFLGGRIKVEISVADQLTQMKLNIFGVTRKDYRTYRCVAKNSLGEMTRKIRLVGKSCKFLNFIAVQSVNTHRLYVNIYPSIF